MSTNLVAAPDPFDVALRYMPAPYARGSATQELYLVRTGASTADVGPYDFSTFLARYGLQSKDIGASYVLTLRVDQLSGPAEVDIAYASSSGAGTAHLVVPAGSLAGTSFALGSLPKDPGLVVRKLTEHPAPGSGQPSGPDKWALTVLLGNVARLIRVASGESRTLAATARDVKAQHHLRTARGASLDRIGQGLGVPRLLPAPYRLDFDPDTVALYHFDDAIAPVIDATRDHPGISVGAGRNVSVPAKFGGACQIISSGELASGGLIVPDALAFAINPATGFTVEMFANLLASPGAQETYIFASKRPRLDQSVSPGWLLAVEPSPAGHDLTFTLTDSAGVVLRVAAVNFTRPADWFHVAAVVDPVAKQAALFLNGQSVATAPLGALGVIDTGADIGLGANSNGASHFVGLLDEVRFSSIARTNFSTVLGANAKPYTVDDQTIALYHLDETDDWIDEERGAHFAINSGARRGVAARFGNGVRFTNDPLPHPRCASERDFQRRLRTGAWDRSAGGALVRNGPYARFGYRQGAISEPGLDGTQQPVIVNDLVFFGTGQQGGLMTTACYGFTPDDPTNPTKGTDPSQTIARFQAAGRSVQEAIDYFGEWRGLGDTYFTAQYQANGITAPHESGLSPPSVAASVVIPGSAEFTFDATTSFTVEAFIKPDAIVDDYPRAIAAARSSGLRAGEANANEPGWALCLGTYHSIPNNLRWVLGDAAGNLVAVHADFALADGTFHHIAGVVDRDLGAALLFVDGIEVGQTQLANLRAAAGGPTAQILIGNAPALNAPYAELIDEVRISRRARRQFRPVLGESDDRYRQRLAIYQPWRLPAFPAIRRGVQTLTLSDPSQADVTGLMLGDDPVPGNLIQLDVDEADSARFSASQWLRIIPEALASGQSIAADGTTPASEPSAAGLQPLPPDSPALLGEPDGTNYTFANPQSRLMVLAAAQALERLAKRLLVVAPAAKLRVQSAYLPAQPTQAGQVAPTTNDNLGRALMLTLDSAAPGLDLKVLGALAFEIGIAYVACGPSSLRLVVAAGADLELTVTTTNPGLDASGRQIAFINSPFNVSINRPKPASDQAARIDWRLVPRGPAAATLAPIGSANSVKSFTGTAAGLLTIEVRYTLPDGVTVLAGSLPIVIAPSALDGTGVLGGDGGADATEAARSGLPDPDFRTDYLISSADPRVDYAPTVPPAPASNLMQLALERALIRLATLAAREPGAPRVTVLSAFDPGTSNLQAVGRGMVLAPSSGSLSAARLGALAFLAGFAYVERRRYPPSVYASVAPGNRFEVISRPIRRLWPNAAISGRGTLMANEFDAAGPADPGFTPSLLQPFNDARAAFPAGVSNLVQPSLASALKALLDALAADGVTTALQVIAGYTPLDPTLLSVGRAVRVRHPAVAAERLAGYALQAGFGFVQHRTLDAGGPAVHMAAYPSSGFPPNLLAGADATDRSLNVYLNTLTELAIRPQLAVKGRLGWDIRPVCPASAELSTALPDPTDKPGIAEKIFQGTRAGAVAAVATFSLSNSSEPYQFLVLAGARAGNDPARQPRLSKDQYDDLLNFLDAHHPLGTEAVTKGLRGFVHGFRRPPRWDRLATAASFPRYRTNK